MKATRNYVIFEVEDTRKTKSGIILPKLDRTRSTTREGVVVSIGPKVEIDLKEGDKILATNNYGHDLHVSKEGIEHHYIVLEQEFILAVVKDE